MRPERLGRYELLRHLASGGMARVYLARATGPGGFARHVVIKMIPAERRDDDAFIAMFLDEARLVATLHHQHIAQVFEVGRADDGIYYLAMEYVHGETVREVLQIAANRRVKLPLELGVSVACAAAAGLHHAHERRGIDGTPLGIVHRDVSPSNLILGFDGSIKLIDFGIAKATLRSTQTATGFIKGKAGYMAPEQARGYAVDRRSDVFALGVLAYELTTQSRAFHADSQFEIMRRTMHGEIEPPSRRVAGFPPALEDVIMTALEVDPDDRFQDAEAMRVALEQVARELGLALGDASVIRALERLFTPRPEPWLVADDPGPDDETTYVRTGSEPIIMVVPRTPTKVRLARGTATPETQAIDAQAIPEPIPVDKLDLTTQPFERLHRIDPMLGAASAAPLVIHTPTPPTPPSVSRMRDTPPRPASATLGSRASGTLPLPVLSLPTALPLPPTRETPLPALVVPLPAAVEPSALSAPEPSPAASDYPQAAPPRLATAAIRAALVGPGRWQVIAILAALVVAIGVLAIASVLTSHAPSAQRVVADAALVVEPPAPTPPAPARTRHAAPAATSPVDASTVMLHVTTEPDGATVVLDGVRLGVTPFSAPVPKKLGLAWLKVRKRKHAAIKTRVSLEADVRWDVELRRLAH